MKLLLKKCYKKFKKIAKRIVLFAYKICTMILPINKKIIMFESNLGRNYTGSPRAVYEEMVKQGLDLRYHCYFIMDEPGTQIPGEGKTVKRTRLLYFLLFAVAGTWVCDTRLPKYIIKRPGCTYIQNSNQTIHQGSLRTCNNSICDIKLRIRFAICNGIDGEVRDSKKNCGIRHTNRLQFQS